MARTKAKPPRGTPCGYCFERQASGYDHLIPISVGGGNEEANLLPCCIRCNVILSDYIFKSIEEKRSYVTAKINGRNGWDAVQALREANREVQEREILLQPKMPLESMGEKSPKSRPVVKARIRPAATIKPRKTFGLAFCLRCQKEFERTLIGQKFCRAACRASWHKTNTYVRPPPLIGTVHDIVPSGGGYDIEIIFEENPGFQVGQIIRPRFYESPQKNHGQNEND